MAAGAELPISADTLTARLYGSEMPELYGAKHDVVTNNTLQMTAGSNVVTCSSAPFTAADTGKLAWAYGAGTNAQHLIGYLVYTDATHCNLMTAAIAGSAVNAVTTISKNGQLVYGTDDNAALQAANTASIANGRRLYFGARKFMTSGTLADGGNQLDMYGAGRKRTEIWCTNPLGFWITDTANLLRCHVHDFTLHCIVHGFADLRATANATGFQQKVFERLEILDFTGCGWQDNTTDGPYYRLKEVSFTGWDELQTICFAGGGLMDSTSLDDVSFGGAYRVGAKFSRGGPNASMEANNGFVNGISGTIAVLSDGAMSAGSNVLTSPADGRFDSSMVGLSVTVVRANTNLGNLQTSIKSVTNATTAVLYNPAVLAVSGTTITIRAKQRPLRTVSDGVATAGSNVVSSATANFTSADIASGINIPGAGWPGAGTGAGDLNARIQSVTNSTTVVINVPATTSVSGAFVTICSPQIKMQLVPSALVNAGLGFTCDDIKFGSELLRPGDIHVAFADHVVDVTVADAAMTAGSADVSSATAGFTANMVKTRYITIAGVGLNGATITARVVGYTSATTITCDVVAITSASAQAMTLYKAHGERMPILDMPSTGIVAQSQWTNCPFSNAGNGANGFTLSPFFSMTPKVYGCNFGPGNIEQGSGYLWHMEFGPGVVATPDRYAQSSQVYPMVDNNAGRDRLSPAISSIPGMLAKQMHDPIQTAGVRMPSLESTPSGASLRVNQVCKTRMNSFGVSANAHKVSSLSDPEMGTDAAEFSFDTSAGTVSCTVLAADVVVGEPHYISFDVARGTTNPVDRINVLVRYVSAGTIHFQEYVDVPANGAETITMRWVPTEASSNFNFVFATDIAGQVKLGEPMLYRSRSPISFFRQRWLSPNGTAYTEGITDAGVLTGITANPPASFVAAPSDVIAGAKGSGALAGAVWPANFECIFVRLWGTGSISNLLFIPTILSGNYLIGLYANSGAGRSAVPTGAAILSTASAPMSGLTANALATIALGGSQAITPGSHWGMLAIDNVTAAVARETVLNTVMSAGYARDQVPGSLQAPTASGTVTTTYWPWMQAT